VKLVIVSEKAEDSQVHEIDPLEEEIATMKLTANLLKEMSFNSTVNKFDYFEKLLSKENAKFNGTVDGCVRSQKEILRKVKMVQRATKEIKNQSAALNYAKVHVQLEELRATKAEAAKYQKVSHGMLKCLQKIDEKLSKP
jgi:hypothetical protein